VASDSDTYRLSLGQVYYWLGKQEDGRKLFEEYLTANSRSFKSLLELGAQYRQIGSDTDARAMGEEAYSKAASDSEHFAAANFRSLCFKDLDDKIAWLAKCDSADADVKASLSVSKGEKAIQDGHDQEAAQMFQTAIDAYGQMTRSASTVNDTAIAYYGLFQANGDRASLDRCVDYFQQAVDLSPSDTVLIYNAAGTILDGAIADVIGDSIDLRALHAPADISMLSSLYKNEAERTVVAEKLKSHPGTARAMSYFQKLMVIAPKKPEPYGTIYEVAQFTHDENLLRGLEQHLQSAGLDSSEQLEDAKSVLTGDKDQKNTAVLTAFLTKSLETLDAVRSRQDRTTAVAMESAVYLMLALDQINGSQDADQIVNLAQDAARISPSGRANGLLGAALFDRAVKRLRKSDANFDAFAGKFEKRMGPTYLIAAAAMANASYQQAVLQDPDVRMAMQQMISEFASYPDSCSANEWAMLHAANLPEAAKAADILKRVPRIQIEDSIELLLNPCALNTAMDWNWLMQAEGRSGDGKGPLMKIAAMGLPIPDQQ
jgi:tetratricopeptide (TPR) repeat protein